MIYHLLKINNLNTTFFSLAIKTRPDNNTYLIARIDGDRLPKALNSIRSVQGDDDRGEAHDQAARGGAEDRHDTMTCPAGSTSAATTSRNV